MAESKNVDESPHVHFPADQVQAHDAEIVVQPVGDKQLDIHLGFLQIHHHYQVQLVIKDKLSEDLKFDPLQNLNVSILEAVPTDDGEGHQLLIDFKAYKEKLLCEELVIADSNNPSETVTLVFHARVLGKGKGTPALRRGIHCIGIDVDDESEHSDWQGFD